MHIVTTFRQQHHSLLGLLIDLLLFQKQRQVILIQYRLFALRAFSVSLLNQLPEVLGCVNRSELAGLLQLDHFLLIRLKEFKLLCPSVLRVNQESEQVVEPINRHLQL